MMYKTSFLLVFRYTESIYDVKFSNLGQGHVKIKMADQYHLEYGSF